MFPKNVPRSVPQSILESVPEIVPENVHKNVPESVTENFSIVPPVKCSPYLEVGVESISVAIFVVYIFVIFWSDIWLKTIILF